MKLRVLPIATLVILSCGGRSELDTGVAGAPSSCTLDGVRICGEGCPELGSSCKGFGCTPALGIVDFAPSDVGVCWADAPNITEYQCGTCEDGQVCIQRSKDQLVCVPESICKALWSRGIRDVCRYADFTPYDGRPVASKSGCPLSAPWDGCHGDGCRQAACSGDCPSCSNGAVCEGRSADHPFGLCRTPDNITTSTERQPPSDYSSCATCMQDVPPLATWACAVFDIDANDSSLARSPGGFCMDLDNCLEVAKSFPGGMSCYDASWNRIGP